MFFLYFFLFRLFFYIFDYWFFFSILVDSFKLVGAGLATFGLCGAAIGIGIIFGSFILAVSRNPGIRSELFSVLILGFALVEATALFSLLMSFLLLFAF